MLARSQQDSPRRLPKIISAYSDPTSQELYHDVFVESCEVVQTVDTSFRPEQHRDAAKACLPPTGRHTWPVNSPNFLEEMIETARESEKQKEARIAEEKAKKLAAQEAESAAAMELEEMRRQEEALREALLIDLQENSQPQFVDDSEDEGFQPGLKTAKQKKKRTSTGSGAAKAEPKIEGMKREA